MNSRLRLYKDSTKSYVFHGNDPGESLRASRQQRRGSDAASENEGAVVFDRRRIPGRPGRAEAVLCQGVLRGLEPLPTAPRTAGPDDSADLSHTAGRAHQVCAVTVTPESS